MEDYTKYTLEGACSFFIMVLAYRNVEQVAIVVTTTSQQILKIAGEEILRYKVPQSPKSP